MSSSIKSKTILLLPSKATLEVVVGQDIEKVRKYLFKKYAVGHEAIAFLEKSHGAVFWTREKGSGKFIIVMYLENLTPSLIAHEATHVTWSVQEKYGNFFCEHAQETQAYWVGHIMDEVLKLKQSK